MRALRRIGLLGTLVAALLIAGCATTDVDRPLDGTYDFSTDVRLETLAKPLRYVSTRPSPERERRLALAMGPVQTTQHGERRYWLWVGFEDWEPFTLRRAIPPRLRLVENGAVLAEPTPLAVDAALPLARPPYAAVPAVQRTQYYEIDARTLAALLGRRGVTLELADGQRDWLPFAAPPEAALALDAFIETHVAQAVAAR